MCQLVKEILPLRFLLRDLNVIDKEPTKIFIDNISAVKLAVNEQASQRTKHIDVRSKWLTEHHAIGNINVNHVKGEDQVANIFTKPLGRKQFERERLMNWRLDKFTS